MSDGREGGFIVVWRRVQSSPLFLSLTAPQRSVLLSVLLLANWKDRQTMVAGRWETIRRGELLQSLEAISRHAKVSVKVVRTTVAKLFADDRPAGGRGPFLTERWIGLGREVGSESGIAEGTVPGTATGTPLRVLTIVNYDEYQSIIDGEGTGAGTSSECVKGTPGAQQGHARGTSRTKGTKEPDPSLFAPSPSDSTPPVAVLPCVGDGPKEYGVTAAQVASWQEAYPGVDVLAEIRKARVWLEARPERRKTFRGMPAFLVGWLNRSQDSARGGQGPPASPDRARRTMGGVGTAAEVKEKPW